jgi:hypothetical protein
MHLEINFNQGRRFQMKIRLRVVIVGIGAALLAFGGPQLLAQTINVGACTSGGVTYKTIQEAVNAATSGSTVQVCPGNYPEQVLITKPLTVEGVTSRRGSSAAAAVILPPPGGVVANATGLTSGGAEAAQILVQNTDGVNLTNLAVDGTDNGITSCAPELIGIVYQNASGTVNGVATRNQTLSSGLEGCQGGLGIFVGSSNGGTSEVTIENSSIHSYQKNGITANEPGTNVIIRRNTVVGLGPTNGAAQNGIQIGFGATGEIRRNSVIDDVFMPGTASATGILVVASPEVRILSNTVATTQGGIVVFSFPTLGEADFTAIERNIVLGTQDSDGIRVCSNNNTVVLNRIDNSSQSAIHLDSSCGSTGQNNTVVDNVINEACAGILAGAGTTGNLIVENTFLNVTHGLLRDDVCSDVVASKSALSTQSTSSLSTTQNTISLSRRVRSLSNQRNLTPARP